MLFLDELGVESFHPTGQDVRIILLVNQPAAGCGQLFRKLRLAQGQIHPFVECCRAIQVKKPTVPSVVDQRGRAGGPAADDGRAGRPSLKDDQSKSFRKGWEDHRARYLEQTNQPRVSRRKSAGKQHPILQSELANILF